MTPKDLLHVWAPPRSPWSPWVKPVLIAQSFDGLLPAAKEEAAPPETAGEMPDFALPGAESPAVVIDLSGVEAVRVGLALAVNLGYRPIPLFNGCAGEREVVPTHELQRALVEAAAPLESLTLADDAPPAFLLDCNRLPANPLMESGSFDNRWMVFAQDFPSANFLRSRGITGILLFQSYPDAPVQDDLAPVLRRWQEAGLPLYAAAMEQGHLKTRPLHVKMPSLFRAYWQRTMVMLGLRRNDAGGFGAVVPSTSAG